MGFGIVFVKKKNKDFIINTNDIEDFIEDEFCETDAECTEKVYYMYLPKKTADEEKNGTENEENISEEKEKVKGVVLYVAGKYMSIVFMNYILNIKNPIYINKCVCFRYF